MRVQRRQPSAPWAALVGYLLSATLLLGGVALLWAQGTDIARALELLREAYLPWLGLALIAEVLRFGALGLLLWAFAALLGVQTPLLGSIRLTLIAISARHLVPFGGIPDYALRARFLQQRGMRAGTLAAYFLLDSTLSWLALISVFGLGFVSYLVTEQRLPPQPVLFGAAALLTLLVLGLLGMLWSNRWLTTRLATWLERMVRFVPAWLGRRQADAPERMLHVVADLRQSLHGAGATPRQLLALAGLALLPLLADVAALAATFAAVGLPVSLPAMLLGYGLAGYLAFLTPLPGDAGVVEVALTLVFASLGYELGMVVVGVVLFRLISFWLPIPIGLLAACGTRSTQ